MHVKAQNTSVPNCSRRSPPPKELKRTRSGRNYLEPSGTASRIQALEGRQTNARASQAARPPGSESRAGSRLPPWPPRGRAQGPALTRQGGRVPLGLEATGLGQEGVVEPAGSGRVRGPPALGGPAAPRRAPRGRSPERVGLLHHLHLGGGGGRGPYGERGSEEAAGRRRRGTRGRGPGTQGH